MSRNVPAFTPMCNRVLRFYFSNPNRESFQSDLARRQFEAARDSLEKLPRRDMDLLRSIVPYNDGCRDISDSYIPRRLNALGMSREKQNYFYDLLRKLNLEIAICMGYIEDKKPKAPISWEFYDPTTGRREYHDDRERKQNQGQNQC